MNNKPTTLYSFDFFPPHFSQNKPFLEVFPLARKSFQISHVSSLRFFFFFFKLKLVQSWNSSKPQKLFDQLKQKYEIFMQKGTMEKKASPKDEHNKDKF